MTTQHFPAFLAAAFPNAILVDGPSGFRILDPVVLKDAMTKKCHKNKPFQQDFLTRFDEFVTSDPSHIDIVLASVSGESLTDAGLLFSAGDSLFRIMLRIPSLQLRLIDIFGQILILTAAVRDAEAAIVLLNQLRFLDCGWKKPNLVIEHLLNVMDAIPEKLQRDLVSLVPELSSQCDISEVVRLLQKMMDARPHLMVACLDAITRMNTDGVALDFVLAKVMSVLSSAPIQDIPVLVRFLLQSSSTEALPKSLKSIRSSIGSLYAFSADGILATQSASKREKTRKSVSANKVQAGAFSSFADGSDPSSLLLEAFRTSILFNERVAKALLKLLQTVSRPPLEAVERQSGAVGSASLDTPQATQTPIESLVKAPAHPVDMVPLDAWLLCLLLENRQRARLLLPWINRQVGLGALGPRTWISALSGFNHVVRSLFPRLLAIARTLLQPQKQSDSSTTAMEASDSRTEAALAIYRCLFEESDRDASLRQTLVAQWLSHIASHAPSEVDPVMRIMLQLPSAQLGSFRLHIHLMIDHIEFMHDAGVKALYLLMMRTDRASFDVAMILLRKQCTHPTRSIALHGLLGLCTMCEFICSWHRLNSTEQAYEFCDFEVSLEDLISIWRQLWSETFQRHDFAVVLHELATSLRLVNSESHTNKDIYANPLVHSAWELCLVRRTESFGSTFPIKKQVPYALAEGILQVITPHLSEDVGQWPGSCVYDILTVVSICETAVYGCSETWNGCLSRPTIQFPRTKSLCTAVLCLADVLPVGSISAESVTQFLKDLVSLDESDEPLTLGLPVPIVNRMLLTVDNDFTDDFQQKWAAFVFEELQQRLAVVSCVAELLEWVSIIFHDWIRLAQLHEHSPDSGLTDCIHGLFYKHRQIFHVEGCGKELLRKFSESGFHSKVLACVLSIAKSHIGNATSALKVVQIVEAMCFLFPEVHRSKVSQLAEQLLEYENLSFKPADLEELLGRFIMFSPKPMESLSRIICVQLSEMIETATGSTIPSIVAYFRVSGSALALLLQGYCQKLNDDFSEADLKRVQQIATLWESLVHIVKLESRRPIFVACMSTAKRILMVLLGLFKPFEKYAADPALFDEIALIMKKLQGSTRTLNTLCNDTKAQMDGSLAKSQVPVIRKLLETFLVRVHKLFKKGGYEESLSVGNLKHKNLAGDEVASQILEQESEGGEVEEEQVSPSGGEADDDQNPSGSAGRKDDLSKTHAFKKNGVHRSPLPVQRGDSLVNKPLKVKKADHLPRYAEGSKRDVANPHSGHDDDVAVDKRAVKARTEKSSRKRAPPQQERETPPAKQSRKSETPEQRTTRLLQQLVDDESDNDESDVMMRLLQEYHGSDDDIDGDGKHIGRKEKHKKKASSRFVDHHAGEGDEDDGDHVENGDEEDDEPDGYPSSMLDEGEDEEEQAEESEDGDQESEEDDEDDQDD